MRFQKAREFNIKLLENQYEYISSIDKINKIIEDKNNIVYEIIEDGLQRCFIILNQFDEKSFFLWDFVIDYRFQSRGYGTLVLQELFRLLKNQFDANLLTTTCKRSNIVAINFFTKNGFEHTEYVKEADEVNLQIRL